MKRKKTNESLHDARSINTSRSFRNELKNSGRLFLLALIAISISFAGCGKDDDDDKNDIPKENHLMYDSQNYEISDGILEYFGQWYGDVGGYNFDITLFSSGISYDEELEDFTGQGNLIIFEMFSSSETELKPGTYTFDPDESYDAGTFDWGFFVLNYNIDNETGDVSGEIAGGTVKVEKSGSTWKITIDCTDKQGKKLTGYYEGALEYYDWSDYWAKSSEALKN